jgi:hypothetical protein
MMAMTAENRRGIKQLGVGLTGVAIGALIGATTGMWWMMGVLGGVFGGMSYLVPKEPKK